MSSNWQNTEYRNIRFVNNCSKDIYVGTEFSAGSDDPLSIPDCNNTNQDLNNLPYSAMTPTELSAVSSDPNNKCHNFRQIIQKIQSGGNAGDYRMKLYKKKDNKCNTNEDEWCRASVKMFPMIIEETNPTVENVTDKFIGASISQGLTEFTFGADPKTDDTAGDDNYDISAIIRQGACSAHSNPYENDYGYANVDEPECKTNPLSSEAIQFNSSVAYDTVELATHPAVELNSQENGCSSNHTNGCNKDQTSNHFYGCGMPRIYTPNPPNSDKNYEVRMEQNKWELYPEGGGNKLNEPERQNMLSEIRKEIFKCSYAQSKLNKTNHPETVRDSESIFNFIPFELKALNSENNTYNNCSNKNIPLKCEPATNGDSSTLVENCQMGYSYQYDDFVAGVTCNPPLNNEAPTYEITYCPNGDIPPDPDPDPGPPDPGPGPPDPGPGPPDPSERARCSTLKSCSFNMILDPLRVNDYCYGDECDKNVDTYKCCKVPSNNNNEISNNEISDNTGIINNRASLSNDNTKIVSQTDDRPVYNNSSLEKKTSHTHIMQSSNYNPVGIDEGSGYSLLSNISSTVSGLGSKSNNIGLQPNNFFGEFDLKDSK
jgi:hypothetical protein